MESTLQINTSLPVFRLQQSVRIQDPGSCVGFAVNGSTYVGITHTGPPFSPFANLSIYKLHRDLNVTLVSVTLLEVVGVFMIVLLLNYFISLGAKFRH